MPFRPPLTADELRAIKERNKDPDVRMLLWEVSRLRSLARASSQVLPMCNPVGATARMLHTALKGKLDEETCVIEHRAIAEQVTSQAEFERTSDSGIGSGEPSRPAVRRR